MERLKDVETGAVLFMGRVLDPTPDAGAGRVTPSR
jgi:hypothetical protein